MKKLWVVLIVALVALPLAAQEVELRDDHPDEYIVREGDTLWDIAGRFLTRPWQWPAIWQANPQVENPHLIYPGDRLSLIYVDGQPRLVLDATRRLSPEIRRSETTGPVTTVSLSVIEPFLLKPIVVDDEELAGLPYVVANEDTRYVSAEPHRAFVRGMDDRRPGDQVIIARLSFQFEEVKAGGRSAVRQNLMRGNLGAVPSDERPIDVGQAQFLFEQRQRHRLSALGGRARRSAGQRRSGPAQGAGGRNGSARRRLHPADRSIPLRPDLLSASARVRDSRRRQHHRH